MSLRTALRNARRRSNYREAGIRSLEGSTSLGLAGVDSGESKETVGQMLERGKRLQADRLFDGGEITIEDGKVSGISKTLTDEEFDRHADTIRELEERYVIERDGNKITLTEKR
jgi:hypothetical protein